MEKIMSYRQMEGAREIEIYVKYQIYAHFDCLGSYLKFKLCCQICRQIQMDKSKFDERAYFCQVKHPRKTCSNI